MEKYNIKKEFHITKEELTILFGKYGIEELKVMYNLFKNADEYDLDEVESIIKELINKKEANNKKTNFDKTYGVKNLDQKELEVLFNIVDDSYMAVLINPENKSTDGIEELHDALYNEMGKRINNSINENKQNGDTSHLKRFNMSNQELKDFFNKYTLTELDQFYKMFDLIFGYYMKDVNEVFNEVYTEKFVEPSNDFEVPYTPTYHNMLDVMKKNSYLTDKELQFLHDFVLSHFNGTLLYLESTNRESYLEFVQDILSEICDEEKIREGYKKGYINNKKSSK